MKENNAKWENIKIEKKILNKVRSHKKKTGISLMAFTKQAILEKLERANQGKLETIRKNGDQINALIKTISEEASNRGSNEDE